MRGEAARHRKEHGTEAASAFYARAANACGLAGSREPVAALAFERLWRHVFVAEDEPEEDVT